MQQEKYELISNALQKHVDDCHKYLDSVTSTDSLLKMTGEQLINLMEFAKAEVNSMTRILMVDFYHIIGMGNMSPVQEMKFLKLVKEYCKFRSDLKTIAANLHDLTKLPKLPTASKFRLVELCDVVLESDVRTGTEAVEIIDESDIAEYRNACRAIKTPTAEVTAEAETEPEPIKSKVELTDVAIVFKEDVDEAMLENYLTLLCHPMKTAVAKYKCKDDSLKHQGGFGWHYEKTGKGHYYQIIARSDSAKAKLESLKNYVQLEQTVL